MGLVPALFSLRKCIRKQASRGRLDALRAAALTLLFVVAAAWATGDYAGRYHEHSLRVEQRARKNTSPQDHAVEKTMVLGPHNAWTVPGKWRNMDLETKVILKKHAILEIRVRAPRMKVAQGIALFLSSDPRFETGFYLERRSTFESLGEGSGPLPVDVPLEVTVKTRGRRFDAFVNGNRAASAEERLFAEGNVVLVSAKGIARIEGLSIRSAAFHETEVSSFPDRALGAAVCISFFLVYVLLTSLFLRINIMRVLEAGAFGLVPVAYGFTRASPVGVLDIGAVAWPLLLASVLFLLFPFIHARRLAWLKCLVLVLAILAADAWTLMICRERAWPVDNETVFDLSLADWSGDRLEEDLVHLQHPIFRRCNEYLACHLLRERSHGLMKAPSQTRILCLGTSSTYGYRVDTPYPLRLEKLLNEEGFDVEVMIGAYPGASGTRVYTFFKNVLLDFSPDIVTLSLFFNDSYALTQADEAAYLERVTGPGYRRSIFDRIGDLLSVWLGAAHLDELTKHFRLSGPEADVGEGPDTPPVLFEAMLRRYAVLARERGIQLVLMKEPLAGGMDRLWKKEFYAAMDRVGHEFGLPVVDPTPLLNARGGARLFMDHVHPYDEGDAVVAEALYPVIRGLIE
jgi:lysophospholipase L1-like esterase